MAETSGTGKEGYPPVEGEQGVRRVTLPRAADYQGSARERFRAGVAAARRYYAGLERGAIDSYCGYIERADSRNEPSAWYDGWDSVCNPEYFETDAAPESVSVPESVSEPVLTRDYGPDNPRYVTTDRNGSGELTGRWYVWDRELSELSKPTDKLGAQRVALILNRDI